MVRRPPRSTSTYTLFPFTSLFRSPGRSAHLNLAVMTASLAKQAQIALARHLLHFHVISKRQTHLAYEKTRVMIKGRSEEHTSELQSLMRKSYAVFCLTNKTASHK